MVEKVGNAKAKVCLQSPSKTRKIDFKCPRAIDQQKKNKDKTNPDRNKVKSTSYNSSFTNLNQFQTQTQTQVFKKDKRHQEIRQDNLATRFNTTKVAK